MFVVKDGVVKVAAQVNIRLQIMYCMTRKFGGKLMNFDSPPSQLSTLYYLQSKKITHF